MARRKTPKYIAIIEDANGVEWAFEGEVQDIPLWVRSEEARSKLLDEVEAYKVINKCRRDGETGYVQLVK